MKQEQSAHDMVDPHSLRHGCTDEAVKCAALRRLAKDVYSWLGGDNRDENDIYKQLECCAARDGYEFAKNLECLCGWWYCTAQLVGILNRYGQYLDEARAIAIRECMECNGCTNTTPNGGNNAK
jgi:hypothetical protein